MSETVVETEHTPGPWAVSDEHPKRSVLEVITGHHVIASLHNAPEANGSGYCEGKKDADGIWRDDYVRQANARLIAAAPDMKSALEKHQAFFDKLVAHCFGSDASEAGSDLDYSEFLEFAEAAGLLTTEGYDPDKHGHGADSAPGDTWYVPTHIGRSALSKAKGGGNV